MADLILMFNLAFFSGLYEAMFGSTITFGELINIQQIFETFVTLVFVFGPLLLVLSIGYLLFPRAKKYISGV